MCVCELAEWFNEWSIFTSAQSLLLNGSMLNFLEIDAATFFFSNFMMLFTTWRQNLRRNILRDHGLCFFTFQLFNCHEKKLIKIKVSEINRRWDENEMLVANEMDLPLSASCAIRCTVRRCCTLSNWPLISGNLFVESTTPAELRKIKKKKIN